MSKKTGLTIGDLILIFNIIIFAVVAVLLSVEISLYSILTYLTASKTVTLVVEGVEEYIGFTIISEHSDAIRIMIIEKMGKGLTIYNGKRGYGKIAENLNKTDVIYSVITRLEMTKLQTEIQKIDPNAFIVMNKVMDLQEVFQKNQSLKDTKKSNII